jgi:hypothetical protein
MTLVAKPIVNNQLWIVLNGTKKVGNVEFTTTGGYKVQIGQTQQCFDSTTKIEDFVKIKFDRPINPTVPVDLLYKKWPNTGNTYNDVMDIKRKLHLYTKEKDSKCYYASGWFSVNINDTWQTMFCPKYIFITRYEYKGPYMTQQEASAA